HPHDTVNNGWPFEAAAIEPLPIHHEATAIPDDNLHSVGALRTVDHRHALHRVMAQCLLCQRRQAIPTLPQFHSLRLPVHHKISGSKLAKGPTPCQYSKEVLTLE